MLTKLQKFSVLHTLRATKPLNIITAHPKLFSSDNNSENEFMDKFARQTF